MSKEQFETKQATLEAIADKDVKTPVHYRRNIYYAGLFVIKLPGVIKNTNFAI